MKVIISGDLKEFCNRIFEATDGLTEDITLLELESMYRDYYSEDNEVVLR